MKTRMTIYSVFALQILVSSVSVAAELTIPNTFQSGQPARAAEMNQNFSAVESAVDDNDTRIMVNTSDIAGLQATIAVLQESLKNANNAIAVLQGVIAGKADVGHNHDTSYSALNHNHDARYSLLAHTHSYASVTHTHAQADVSGLTSALNTHTSQISAINNSNIMDLDPYLTVTTIGGAKATFSGLNVQLVNGSGMTNSVPNGLGNFIIGYDEPRSDASFSCSLGIYTDQTTCQNSGYTWAISHKSGSHYLVVGAQNNYSRYGGLVVGYRNTSNNAYASISGGANNTASGFGTSVNGGFNNIASGYMDSVSGGISNTARGDYSSVNGGLGNTASGYIANVSGGSGNVASGNYASISGGHANTASGESASISGGNTNVADMLESSILGGVGQNTSTASQTIPALP